MSLTMSESGLRVYLLATSAMLVDYTQRARCAVDPHGQGYYRGTAARCAFEIMDLMGHNDGEPRCRYEDDALGRKVDRQLYDHTATLVRTLQTSGWEPAEGREP